MSDEEKNDGEIYWVGGLFTALVTLNFLIIHSFADDCTTADQICVKGLNPWYVFFMRFQTFITGLLAIVAALITVHQMRKSDRRADDRHESLMKIQLKSEAEGIDTLVQIYGVSLVIAKVTSGAFGRQFRKFAEDPEKQTKDGFLRCLSDVRDSISGVEQIIEGKHWEEFHSILTAEARKSIYMLRECVKTANLIFHKTTYVNAHGELRFRSQRLQDQAVLNIHEAFEPIPHQLDVLQRAIARRSSELKGGSEK